MKKLLSFIFLLSPAFCLLPSYFVFSQNVHPVSGKPLKYCGTDEATAEIFKQYPHLKEAAEIIQQQENQKTNPAPNSNPPVYTIPVVVHILHDYGAENVPDANVKDAIRILNEDFRKLNTDISQVVPAFQGITGDAEIEFELATLDPNGNCTNGIDRIVTQETYVGDDGSKLNQWPRNKYLNVWTVNNISSGAAGYTYVPANIPTPSVDGIIILYDYFGALGPSSAGTSRALSHEVGHWINLQHCWGSTNQPGVSCGDDGVTDTPITMGWSTCNLTTNDVCSPGTEENVQNYMEYAYCQKMFTLGQCTRMRFSLTSATAQRNNLWTTANLAATGVSTTAQLCTADFSVNKRVTCVGTAVTFTDLSWNATPTSWQWDVDNNSSVDYTTQNPSHTYNTPGTYSVTLTVSDGVSTKSVTKASYIIVLGNTATAFPNYSEGFENTGYPYNDCYINVVSGINPPVWNTTASAAFSGASCLTLNNYTSNTPYIEEAIFPSIDLSFAANLQMTFQVAYAQRNSSDLDQLRVLVSTSCGSAWTQKYSKNGTTLATTTMQSSAFTPTSANQWRQETVNISSSAGNNNFRFKFDFNGGVASGNNIYIDDINITISNVGVTEEFSNEFGLSVSPNPFNENTTVSFIIQNQHNVSLSVYDVVGREIIPLANNNELSAGSYSLPLNRSIFMQGVYFVKLMVDGYSVTKKIIVH